ncbi:MAG: hypothetical protein K6B72_05305 [Lachnospiraceae bacterium]|nr:hypothetical protein [Lachnospiraceae bacterium]
MSKENNNILKDDELDEVAGGRNSASRKYNKNIGNLVDGGMSESQSTVPNQTANTRAGGKNGTRTGRITK